MPYTDSILQAISEAELSGTTRDFAYNATALMRVNQTCDLYAVGVEIITAPAVANGVCTITLNVAPGNSSGAVAVATITIPYLTAANGQIYWQDPEVVAGAPGALKSLKLIAGQELVFAMGGASMTTMVWRPWIEAYPRNEVKQNIPAFIQSTT